MKLSKKNAARQSAIQRAIASGKALGGLLVGFAATVAGCGERHAPTVMGKFPASHYQENAKNENTEKVATEGEIPEPPKPNAVNEDCSNALHVKGKIK